MRKKVKGSSVVVADSLSRVYADICLSSVVENYKTIKKRVSPSAVMAVLKADAYGLGAAKIAVCLEKAGVSRIGVAEIKEAFRIQEYTSLPVQIIGGLLPFEVTPAVDRGVVCPAGSYDEALRISRAASALKKTAIVHILVDTGMGRLGISSGDVAGSDSESVYETVEEIKKILSLPFLDVEGIYTHFSKANDPEDPHTAKQLNRFRQILRFFPAGQFRIVHAANSDAVNNVPDSFFSMVRCGINLYGVFDTVGSQAYQLNPALTLRTFLLTKRLIRKGSPVGYGCEYIAPEDIIAGVVCAGYADGIPMGLSHGGHVIINGEFYPVVGRVSMDYLTVFLGLPGEGKTDLCFSGSEVVLIGKDGNAEITVGDYARYKGTHPYDVICSLGHRVKKRYLS